MIAPIYLPSTGRSASATTPRLLQDCSIPFILAVEPQEAAIYRAKFPDTELLVLPEGRQGCAYVRRKIQEHSEARGDSWHWQIDDNIRQFWTRFSGKKQKAKAAFVLGTVEYETARFTNVGIAGPMIDTYAFSVKTDLAINRGIYSCMLIRNGTGYYFRPGTVDDCDFNLQVLSSRFWCAIKFNRLTILKTKTGTMRGGNTDSDYLNDGRLKLCQGLADQWPDWFRIKSKDPPSLAPSRIWSTFPQRPKLADGNGRPAIFCLTG